MNTFQDNYFDFRFHGDLNLLYCGNRENSIDHRYTHTQNAYLLTYIVSGNATLTSNGKKFALKSGDFYVLFPASGASYTTKAKKPWSIRWVTLTGSQLEQLLPLMGYTRENPIHHLATTSETERILEELFTIAPKTDLKNKLYALSLLYELLSAVSASPSLPAASKTVTDAVAFISEHYNAPTLSVEGLAAAAFLNANYFSKLFSAHVGISPSRFIQKVRMEKAKKLLLFSDLSVGEIAIATGYPDTLYFSRVFRRYAGLSPSKFRSTSHQ